MRLAFYALTLTAFLIGLLACVGEPGGNDRDASGETLAQRYCAGCHAFPDPQRLSKAVWRQGVLPHMALRLGRQDSLRVRMDMYEGLQMRSSGAFPAEPVIDSLTWKKIVDYYVDQAPDSLPAPAEAPAELVEPGLFRERSLDLGLDGGPLTTLVHWDADSEVLFVGEGNNNLARYRGDGTLLDFHGFPSPPVAVADDGAGGIYVLCIGHIHPNDEPRGSLFRLDRDGRSIPLLDKLPRPVAMATGDLDGDGIQDLVMAGFGHYNGRLSWWRGLGDHRFEENILLAQPGALSTYIRDLNEDGMPDILTLMAQGDERIIAHYNRGGGRFEMEVLLRFDPVMGSSYLQPVDLDKDGDLDLIYTNGDNADFSYAQKPYHGLRLYENMGGQQFREVFFLPAHGATKAVPLEANGDDAPDIALIAFFPDFSSEPLRSLLLLEQQPGGEGLDFRLRRFPKPEQGRWLTVGTGDFNADGLDDLALGSFTFSPTPTPRDLMRQWMDSRIDVMLLYQQASSATGRPGKSTD